jgi:hypothetical protein
MRRASTGGTNVKITDSNGKKDVALGTPTPVATESLHRDEFRKGRFRWRRVSQREARWSIYLLVVNLPTWFKIRKPNANAAHSYHGERYQKCVHDLSLQEISNCRE